MTWVELRWQVRGEIAADYGYSLFAAVCRRLDPRLHAEDAPWTMSPVVVEAGGARGGVLSVERWTLAVRCGSELVADFAGLYAPTGLAVRETGALQLAPAPTVHVLRPSPVLHSERVLLKCADRGKDRETFRDRLERRLRDERVRFHSVRVGAPFRINVSDLEFCGYAAEVDGLSDRDSLYLQERGLGGRVRMGCGFMRA